MGHIKEPFGVDLIVAPMPLTDTDRQSISALIAEYKLTGDVQLSIQNIKNRLKKRTSRKALETKKNTSKVLQSA